MSRRSFATSTFNTPITQPGNSKSMFRLIALVALYLSFSSMLLAQAIPSSFFGMDINQNNANDPWPSSTNGGVSFGTYRTLGSAIKWSDLYNCNTNQYVFDANPTHNPLQKWMDLAKAGGQKVMFTAYYTPSCLVDPNYKNDASCAYAPGQPGGCNLPADVLTALPGDPMDSKWITFLTHLVAYLKTYYPGQLTYLEVWNEPNINSECNSPTNPNNPTGNCSPAALVQMTKDAQCILKGTGTGCNLAPTVQVVSPAPTAAGSQSDCFASQAAIAPYLKTLLLDGVANYADVIGFHGYMVLHVPSSTHDPAAGASCINDLIASVRSVVVANATKNPTTIPIYDTEGSWGADQAYNNSTNDTDMRKYSAGPLPGREAAFTGIYYLIQASNTVCSGTCNKMAGFNWYAWDIGNTGEFWDQTLTPAKLIDAGKAYQNVYPWLQGATPTGPCTKSGTVWTCNFTRAGNYVAQAVWDTSLSCGSSGCPMSTNYTIPKGKYVKYLNLYGNSTTINATQTSVGIGLVPILLHN